MRRGSAIGAATLAVALLSTGCAGEPALPIASGVYRFEQKSAEDPSMPGATLEATIEGRRIELANQTDSPVFQRGVVARGTLAWHARSRQWIIAAAPGDADADEVGGCSDGPEVVDPVARIYWTC